MNNESEKRHCSVDGVQWWAGAWVAKQLEITLHYYSVYNNTFYFPCLALTVRQHVARGRWSNGYWYWVLVSVGPNNIGYWVAFLVSF